MIDANASYADAVDEQTSRNGFVWTMVGFLVLDVMLVLWVLNPFASFSKTVHLKRVKQAVLEQALSDEGVSKPSPFIMTVNSQPTSKHNFGTEILQQPKPIYTTVMYRPQVQVDTVEKQRTTPVAVETVSSKRATAVQY